MAVYLLHLDKPLGNPEKAHGQAQHYIGYCRGSVEDRIAKHRNGNGAKLTAAAAENGIEMIVVRTWSGGRDFERHLKAQKNAKRFCPICNPTAANCMAKGDSK